MIASIFKSLYFLKWCPIFDTSPLIQFSKFNKFLWVCWFLGKNLSNLVPPVWKLHNPYCHTGNAILVSSVITVFNCNTMYCWYLRRTGLKRYVRAQSSSSQLSLWFHYKVNERHYNLTFKFQRIPLIWTKNANLPIHIFVSALKFHIWFHYEIYF